MAITNIPDDSITAAFGTNEYTEISLLQPYSAKVDLSGVATSAQFAECQMTQITWGYSAQNGISQTESDPTTLLTQSLEGQTDYCFTAQIPPQTQPAGIKLSWSITVTGSQSHIPVFNQFFMARYYMPLWNQLSEAVQGVLQAVVNTLEFLHDNSYGMSKPNLAENLQVHYSLEDVAQCAKTALMVWQSSIIQPTSFTLASLPAKYYGLLYTATLRELCHRIYIGYLETPDKSDVDIPGADRRGYYDKWKTEYDKLTDQYNVQLGIYEREQLDLCGSVNLVAGGYFGRSGALIRNQELQAMQNGVIQNQFFPVRIDFAPGPNTTQ